MTLECFSKVPLLGLTLHRQERRCCMVPDMLVTGTTRRTVKVRGKKGLQMQKKGGVKNILGRTEGRKGGGPIGPRKVWN